MIVVRPRRRSRLLRLAARCPYCDRPPAERLPDYEAARYADDDPERVVMWTQCRGRGCGRVYPLPARAFQEARPE